MNGPVAMQSISFPQPSLALDAMKATEARATRWVAIASFTALAVVAAQFRLYLWEVPFTLQTAVAAGAGLFLGSRNGAISMSLYLLLGLVLPVFAGAVYGLDYFFTVPSAGYVLAFPIMAAIVGRIAETAEHEGTVFWASIVGMLFTYLIGATVLYVVMGYESIGAAVMRGVVPFVPADLAKMGGVTLLYGGIRRLMADR